MFQLRPNIFIDRIRLAKALGNSDERTIPTSAIMEASGCSN